MHYSHGPLSLLDLSLLPGTNGYIVALVNDGYPNVNSARVYVNIAFQYISPFDFCAFIAGLAMLGTAIVGLIVMALRKVQL